MTTRLGLHAYDSFEKYMTEGGFVQELHHDEGYLVPCHEYSFVLPHDGKLHVDTMYQLYCMYTSFVRTQMVLDSESFVCVSNEDGIFTMLLLHHYTEQEDVISFLRQRGYGNEDYYIVKEMGVHPV